MQMNQDEYVEVQGKMDEALKDCIRIAERVLREAMTEAFLLGVHKTLDILKEEGDNMGAEG